MDVDWGVAAGAAAASEVGEGEGNRRGLKRREPGPLDAAIQQGRGKLGRVQEGEYKKVL